MDPRNNLAMNFICKVLMCCILTLPLIAYGQSSSARTDEIIRSVFFIDGYIDRDMHREFWAAVEKRDKRETEQLLKWVNGNILMMQEYQQELWQSALISYRYRKVVKTDRLIKLESELPIVLKNSLPFSPGSPEHVRNAETINRGLSPAMENARNLLNSAAQHTEFRSVAGEVGALNEAKIIHVIEGIKGSVYRIRKLLSKEWKE